MKPTSREIGENLHRSAEEALRAHPELLNTAKPLTSDELDVIVRRARYFGRSDLMSPRKRTEWVDAMPRESFFRLVATARRGCVDNASETRESPNVTEARAVIDDLKALVHNARETLGGVPMAGVPIATMSPQTLERVIAVIKYQQRIVDLALTPGTRILPSVALEGWTVVIDGKTGIDSCERTPEGAIEVLFENIDRRTGRFYSESIDAARNTGRTD